VHRSFRIKERLLYSIILTDIPVKRKSRSKADDLDKIANCATTNNILVSINISIRIQYSLFPAFAMPLSYLVYWLINYAISAMSIKHYLLHGILSISFRSFHGFKFI
jgi:fatty-acid desaturase